jgi:hypothetical protein
VGFAQPGDRERPRDGDDARRWRWWQRFHRWHPQPGGVSCSDARHYDAITRGHAISLPFLGWFHWWIQSQANIVAPPPHRQPKAVQRGCGKVQVPADLAKKGWHFQKASIHCGVSGP